jgi:hypothetical protein
MHRIVSLPRLLRQEVDQSTNKMLGLDWKQQFKIAAALAWAVLHLCDSPWLKESLDDEEIHFFLHDIQGTDSSHVSAQPYISYDFPFPQSNSGSQAAQSTPNAQFQVNQIQNMMLFTLAIRLIELGLNKPFAKLRKKYLKSGTTAARLPGTTTMAAPGITAPTACDDYKVAQQQIDRLKLTMGNFYAGAVESCLRFGSLERGPMNAFENSSFLKNFFDSVVAPIQATLELRLNL